MDDDNGTGPGTAGAAAASCFSCSANFLAFLLSCLFQLSWAALVMLCQPGGYFRPPSMAESNVRMQKRNKMMRSGEEDGNSTSYWQQNQKTVATYEQAHRGRRTECIDCQCDSNTRHVSRPSFGKRSILLAKPVQALPTYVATTSSSGCFSFGTEVLRVAKPILTCHCHLKNPDTQLERVVLNGGTTE